MDQNTFVNRPARKTGILVVDGEPVVRTLLDLVLRGEGFAVWLAGDGPEALEVYCCNAGAIDLVLLEVRLPGLDGPQTLASLRELNPAVRCCFMTGYAGAYTEEELLGLGAAALLNKPFGPDEIVPVLRRLLASPHRGPHQSETCPSVLSWRQWGAV